MARKLVTKEYVLRSKYWGLYKCWNFWMLQCNALCMRFCLWCCLMLCAYCCVNLEALLASELVCSFNNLPSASLLSVIPFGTSTPLASFSSLTSFSLFIFEFLCYIMPNASNSLAALVGEFFLQHYFCRLWYRELNVKDYCLILEEREIIS